MPPPPCRLRLTTCEPVVAASSPFATCKSTTTFTPLPHTRPTTTPPRRHPNMACKPATTPTCCDATPTHPRPAATPPQRAQDPQCHPVTARKTRRDANPPRYARLAMTPTHPTNDKTHPNATLSCTQDPLRCHHDEDYHDHVSEDDDSNDDGAGDDGGGMAAAGAVTGVGLPVHILIYSNKIVFCILQTM